jgi:phospho-N-acetylmuramoyl-pentapeptide-transferase
MHKEPPRMGSLVLAFLAVFLVTAAPGRLAIDWLRGLGAKQNVSADAPTAHAAKQGTPTMGGVMFLVPFVLVVGGILLRHGQLRAEPALLPVFLMTVAFALIGFADDYLSKKRGKNLGLTSPQKFLLQTVVAVIFALWLARGAEPVMTQVQIAPAALAGIATGRPAAFSPVTDLGWSYYPLAVLFIVGLSNATNFTDGLDGLAAGTSIVICIAAAALTWIVHPGLSLYTMALAGGLAGFLWWNAHPAKVFMGDTGSLPIGAALAGVALAGKQEVGVIVASLVCWAELISVMIQVGVFKWRKRARGIEYARANRIFRRTPLHHHFEELGVQETAIVTRFWIAGALCAAIALLWGRIG